MKKSLPFKVGDYVRIARVGDDDDYLLGWGGQIMKIEFNLDVFPLLDIELDTQSLNAMPDSFLEELMVCGIERIDWILFPIHNCLKMRQRDTPQQRQIAFDRVYKIAQRIQKEKGVIVDVIVIKNQSDNNTEVTPGPTF